MKFLHFNITLPPGSPVKARRKYQSRTVAIEPVVAKEIQDLAKHFLNLSAATLSVTLNVGITFLSLKNRYSKKEGRAEAIKKMAPTTLEVKTVQITKSHIFVQLSEHQGVTLLLRMNKATGFCTVTGNLTVGE